MGKRPPKDVQLAQKQVDIEHIKARKSLVFWDNVFSTLRTGIRWTGAVACMGFVYLSTRELAGSRTEVIIEFLARLSADRYVAYSIAALSSLGFAFQRHTNKKLAKEKGEYIQELERRLDPKRSSSELDEQGMPDEEDLDGT